MDVLLPKAIAPHLARSVRTLRRRYRHRLERCQRKFSETAVHDLRIETRRLLALLDLLRTLHFGGDVRKARKDLKRRLDSFDALRDTHVCLTLLKPLRREFPETRLLDSLWRRQERELIGELCRGIKATRQRRLQKRLKAIEETLAATGSGKCPSSAEQLAQAALGEAFARVIVLRRQICRRAPATIHRTRVAFKRVRYMSELLQPLAKGITDELLARMRGFQKLMGDIQDLEVLLHAVAAAVETGAVVPADGRRLCSTLRLRRRDAIDRFLLTLEELPALNPTTLSAPSASPVPTAS